MEKEMNKDYQAALYFLIAVIVATIAGGVIRLLL